MSVGNYASTVGRTGTVTTLSNIAARHSISSIYGNCYLRLKSQKTILDSLQSKASNPPESMRWEEKQKLAYVGYLIESMGAINFVSLFDAAESAITSIRSLTDDPMISPDSEKLLNTFMSAAVAITKVANELGVTFLKPKSSHETEDDMDGEIPIDCDVLVCRICDNSVPADMFEEHTQSCLKSYQSESAINDTNEKLKELQRVVAEKFLESPWPGTKQDAISRLIPSLHLIVLLRRALTLDPHISDTIDELMFVLSVLDGFNFAQLNKYAAEAKALIREKIKSSNALNDAWNVLRKTRLDGDQGRIGQTSIADFRFIKRISRGAFASVFLAEKKTTGDIFAIKATPKSGLKQKNQVRRILAEKDILLQFSSPYIVKFFYSIIGEHNLYLVTEFVPGGDLYSLLENVGALGEDAAKIYAMEVLLALRYLRQNGIIHRDIKPDNILVSAKGMLKLTDFGLSYMGMVDRRFGVETDTEGGDELRQASSFVGTPDYIAPEIILNQSHSFTVDYWSLGIMIYELVYGVPPFHGVNEQETQRKILLGHIGFDGTNTPEFEDLIRRLLTINPVNRLGAKSVEEIINHPWFTGVDPEKDPPPFVPKLESETDTNYFEQRYSFDNEEDASILYDLQVAVVPSEFINDPLTDDDISAFPSVALDELGNANREIVQEFHHKQSMSSLTDSLETDSDMRRSTSFSKPMRVSSKKKLNRHHSFFRTSSTRSIDRGSSKITPQPFFSNEV